MRAPSDDGISAWEDFYAAHDPTIRAIVERRVADPGDADDLVQDIWFSIVRRLPKLALDSGRGTLDAWVATVARHRTARHARFRRKHRTETLTEELVDLLLDSADGPESTLERQQRQEQVRAAIITLVDDASGTSRQIVMLHWVQEQPLSVIAAALSRSEDSVWSVIRASRRKLLRFLLQAGLDGGMKKI